MKKITQSILIILCVFAVGCASTNEQDVEVRPLPPEDDISHAPPMPEPQPEPQQPALPEDDPYSEPVHVPTNEELNIAPDADSYEQVRYNEEVEQVARRARQSYTPEIDHTPGEEIYVELQMKNFNDKDQLDYIRDSLLAGTHFNYKIKELSAPNRKTARFKLWSKLSNINLYQTLGNLFQNDGHDVRLEKRSEHLFVVTPNY